MAICFLKGMLPATHRPLRADNATIKFAARAIPGSRPLNLDRLLGLPPKRIGTNPLAQCRAGRPPRAFVSYGREWGIEKLIATRQVRSRLFAGGSRIQTTGPAEDPRRRRDIGSRRAAFSVAARRADTSPSLETLVVSRGTDGSIRLVPAVSQTNSEGCGVG